MRLAPLALACSLSLSSTIVLAKETLDVTAIQTEIAAKQKEFDSFNQRLQSHINALKQLEQELTRLRKNSSTLEAARKRALEEMNVQYQKMIDDPNIDITMTRENYQKSVGAHKKNKEDITSQLMRIQDKQEEVEIVRVSKHALLNTLEGLKERYHKARVDRLYREFNQEGRLDIQHTITCGDDDTLSRCKSRGKLLAKQKASKQFLDQLYTSLTESTVAKRERGKSDAKVKILGTTILDSGFSGQGNYHVNVSLAMKGSLNREQACNLLNLDARYCIAFNNKTISKPIVSTLRRDELRDVDDSIMYELTVRSNVYDDEVFIDGVSYGTTRLTVMLPAGEHDIEVVKLGYEPFKETLFLRENQTLKAKLDKAEQIFKIGEQIQDILLDDKPGPAMVVIPAGSFQMGDISGNGLDNERPVTNKSIPTSFSIGQKEVTVADFSQFIEASNYTTEAEKGEGCAAYQGAKPVYESALNWRTPGFEQSEEHPVVCVSINDAQAYVDWLSEVTGKRYRLPMENEWEYAARSGSEEDYWWGEAIGTNRANCGWCGSKWSNAGSAPVSSFKRNGFGLYDTVGNVWEWSIGAGMKNNSVVRGGAWNFAPSLARVSTRMELSPDFRSNYIGFRVVRER
ncbi:formylglycine-generating enzyme family protein [Algicola sagamiensis]|uniref:formylglycine-generating enzyme family protein n=1 Tax=Algicola sagamiensis TaxID=163869 RepID=UPI00037EC920|nr:SUMF1/EgtB/PvdO family nonheme iron enzyme [Algicola sagamiensis]